MKWVRVSNPREVPKGVRWRFRFSHETKWEHYADAEHSEDGKLWGTRVKPNTRGEIGGRGHISVGEGLEIEYAIEIPEEKNEKWIRATRPEDVPMGARWRWRWTAKAAEEHGFRSRDWDTYIRIERPNKWNHNEAHLPPSAIFGEHEVSGREVWIDLADTEIEVEYEFKENEMIDILTASKGQLIEEAVRKFGEDARENALRTRLDQLREALQKNEAPAWWAIGNGVRPKQGGGSGSGRGRGQGGGGGNVVVLGRLNDTSVDLTGPQVAEMVKPFLQIEPPKIDEHKVAQMVDQAVQHYIPAPTEVKLVTPEGETREIGKVHRMFPELLFQLNLGHNVLLVGPAGSFKTSSVERAAEVLGLPFYMTSVGMQTSKADLLGYQDAHGNTVRTHLRNAYEHGGVFLLDEADAGNANVLTVINALLANDLAAFPDKMVHRHKDFRFVAAANTFGRGADRQYVGRNQLDAATLDRFVTLVWDYDEDYEVEIAGRDQIEWVRYVQKVRKAIARAKVRHIVSPRASIFGARMLRAGKERGEVENIVLWTPMTVDDARKVKENLAV